MTLMDTASMELQLTSFQVLTGVFDRYADDSTSHNKYLRRFCCPSPSVTLLKHTPLDEYSI
jgi:hypothetical protein